MKKFSLVLLISAVFCFSGCVSSGISRYNTFVPIEESCVIFSESKSHPEYLWVSCYQIIDGKYQYTPEGSIVPAGKYLVKGEYLAYVGTGEYYMRAVYGGAFTTYERDERLAKKYIYAVSVFDFEPGCYYSISFDKNIYSTITVKPTETEGIYADEEGNLYPSKLCTILNGDRGTKYVNALQANLIEDKQLGKTYFSSEGIQYMQLGVQHLNMLGVGLGNSYGFQYLFNPFNIHVNGEWGLGLGFGNGKFDDTDNVYLGAGLPIHVGGTVELEFYKNWNLGLGGGYLWTPFMMTQNIFIFGTPYVRATINRFLYVEYYFTPGGVIWSGNGDPYLDKNENEIKFGPAPLYSAFGLGVKYSI